MSVRVEYGGVAVGARENFAPEASEQAPFALVPEIKESASATKKYGNPCELYTVILDGSVTPIEEGEDNEGIGWWSEQITGEDGMFETPIVLTMTAKENYSSNGITIGFDTLNDIYAESLKIEWYRGDEKLDDDVFMPNSSYYFCKKSVEFYNKIVITFYSLNMPYCRLRISSVEFGANITFTGAELLSVKLTQEMNPISVELPISTCDISLDDRRGTSILFEEAQPLKVYFNDTLKGHFFVRNAKQKSRNRWTIDAEDYISVLENSPFVGGIYADESAVMLVQRILEAAKVPYEIGSELQDTTVSGYIPYTNCREALLQVLFAAEWVCETKSSEKVKISALKQTDPKDIPLSRMMQGAEVSKGSRVTAVEVTAYSYTPSQDTLTAYEGDDVGEMYVTFSEPLHSLTITNGEIAESGTNYAVINATKGCKLYGKKYQVTTITKRKKNPLVLSSDAENVVSIKNATLISPKSLDNLVDLCYNYYVKIKQLDAKIIDRRVDLKSDTSAEVGDVIVAETGDGDVFEGVIERQSYSLEGGILVKDSKVKEWW